MERAFLEELGSGEEGAERRLQALCKLFISSDRLLERGTITPNDQHRCVWRAFAELPFVKRGIYLRFTFLLSTVHGFVVGDPGLAVSFITFGQFRFFRQFRRFSRKDCDKRWP
jgi:hypothetical protein